MCSRFVYFLLFISFAYSADIRVDPLVQTQQGLVRGQRSSDGSYSTFLGIPYASVNLSNPFGAFNPPPIFEDTFQANDGSIECPQSGVFSSSSAGERATLDCLRLNIYVPTQAGTYNPLPVLVWIHGGGYGVGRAGYHDPRFLVRHDIIVVTINYRLGPYGFLCLDTPLVPGNQGLKDQYEALRWVRQNIAAFGGNPYNVTIGGQSAGSGSVLMQLYSTRPKLFHKVIAQSGTSTSPILGGNGDDQAALKMATYLGYNASDTNDALRLLADTPFELVTAAINAINVHLEPCRERSFPGVEKFLDTHPLLASNARKASGTPIMIGHTSLELPLVSTLISSTGDPFYDPIRDYFNFEEDEIADIVNIFRHFYIGDRTVSADVEYEISQFTSDIAFDHPTQRAIDILLNENAGPIYNFLFSYVDESRGALGGAVHGAELSYLFAGAESVTVEDNEERYLLMQRMTTMWTNFVKYGNPTPSVTDLLPVRWEPVSNTSRPYLNIDSELTLESRVFSARMAFWDLFYSAYGDRINVGQERNQ